MFKAPRKINFESPCNLKNHNGNLSSEEDCDIDDDVDDNGLKVNMFHDIYKSGHCDESHYNQLYDDLFSRGRDDIEAGTIEMSKPLKKLRQSGDNTYRATKANHDVSHMPDEFPDRVIASIEASPNNVGEKMHQNQDIINDDTKFRLNDFNGRVLALREASRKQTIRSLQQL